MGTHEAGGCRRQCAGSIDTGALCANPEATDCRGSAGSIHSRAVCDECGPCHHAAQAIGHPFERSQDDTAGQLAEVAPDTNFQPGDRLRLSLQVSDSGYLYIINRGSSGTWTQLFPSPDLPNTTNAVVPGATYSVPQDRNFVVSNPAGEEKLFIILSRTPELDIQSLTMDMSRRESGRTSPQAPAKEEPRVPAHQPSPVTVAENLPPMNDAMVDRMRIMYARDLIIEKVDEQTPGTRKENAVYAVNPGDGSDTRVVLDAQIKHK